MKSFAAILLLLISTASCASDPLHLENEPAPASSAAHVQAAVGESFRLRPGEVATVGSGQLLVAFRGIRQDSRCPIDAVCVWAGDAEASVGVTTEGGRWNWSSLHTNLEPRTLHAHGYAVTLDHVEPANVAETQVPAERYVAVLSVVRD